MTIFDILKRRATVFDVGANKGEKLEQYLANICNVHAFEPQKKCCDILRKKYAHIGGIYIHECAVGDKNRKSVKFNLCNADTLSTFSRDWMRKGRFAGRYTWDNVEKVKMITLDTAIKKYGMPDYCKIDVEGFELQVLKGLTQKIPIISFEFVSEFWEKLDECIERCDKLGYTSYNFVIGQGLELDGPWTSAENLLKHLKGLDPELLFGDIYAR